MQQGLEILYTFIPCQQLALGNSSFLLQCGVLVDKLHMSPRQSHAEGRLAFCTYLLLNQGKLLEVALQERHLLLLSFAITVADDIVVLLFDLV